jgi:Zn finger protein HypA/HybF involved in hydrogenase expression
VAGTSLEGARLAIEVVNRIVVCACGRAPIATVDDLLGRVWVCGVCGHAEEIDPLDDLALIEVGLTPLDAVVTAQKMSA